MHVELASSHKELYLTCSGMSENLISQTQVIISYIPLPLECRGEMHSEHSIDEESIIGILQEREPIL
jgi:hypothetical protein